MHQLRLVGIISLLAVFLLGGCGKTVTMKAQAKTITLNTFFDLKEFNQGYQSLAKKVLLVSSPAVLPVKPAKTEEVNVAIVTVQNKSNKRITLTSKDFKLVDRSNNVYEIKAVKDVGLAERLIKDLPGTYYAETLEYYGDYAKTELEPNTKFTLVFDLEGFSLEDVKYISFDDGTYRAVAKVK